MTISYKYKARNAYRPQIHTNQKVRQITKMYERPVNYLTP